MLTAVRGSPAADASRLHLDLTAVRFAGQYPARAGRPRAGPPTGHRPAGQDPAGHGPGRGGAVFPAAQGISPRAAGLQAAIEALAAALPPGLVVVADSGLGYLEHLCAADAGEVRFVVPLRADTGWAARFDAEVGHGGLAPCRARLTSPSASADCRPASAPGGRACCAPFPVTSRDTGARHDLRAAYIWSSEEAASVAGSRERALAKAEEALTKIRNGLGGRYYKTRKQVDAKVAQILTGQAAGLIAVRTATKAGKPVISWAPRDRQAIAAAPASTGCTRWPPTCPTRDGSPLTALEC